MKHLTFRVCAAACLALLASAGLAQAPQREELPLRRWAILCSDPLQDAGLGDLLTGTLSQQSGIELVEREQLEQVVRELVLSAGNADSTTQRLELGRLLKADGLVLLSLETHDAKPALKIILSETRYGARIHVGLAPYAAGQLDQAAAAVVSALEQTRRRFSQGIQRMVGVSNFVSKNLVHDYDQYQAGLAELLQAALVRTPGVAVIEIDEARAIRKELELAAADKLDRLTPWLISGEFTVTSPRNAVELELKLAVTLNDGGPEEVLTPEALTLSAATQYLSQELPRRIQRQASAEQGGLSRSQQFDWLIARADEFAALGDWEHSVRLREAALLLSPDDAAQHRLALRDYGNLDRLQRSTDALKHGRPDPALESLARRIVDRYLVQLSHVEHLIRRQLIDYLEANRLVREHSAGNGFIFIWPVVDEAHRELQAQPQFDRAEQARRQFIGAVYPLLAGSRISPASENVRQHVYSLHAGTVIDAAMNRRDRRFRNHEDLTFIRDMLEQYLPPGLPPPYAVELLIRYDGKPRDNPAAVQNDFTLSQWQAFLESLIASRNEGARFLGHYMHLNWCWRRRVDDPPPATLQAMLDESSALIKEYRRLQPPDERYPQEDRELEKLLDLHYEIGRALTVPNPEAPPRELPIVRQLDAQKNAPARQAAEAPRPQLHFKPVEIRVRDATGREVPWPAWKLRSGQRPILNRMLACGDALDVLWCETALLGMPTPGLLEEWFVEPQARLCDVQWDGQYVWMATLNQGLYVFDGLGNLLARIGAEDGLLPCDKALLLHPVAPGMVCAVGAFGPQSRAWCARVELAGKQVHVFHQATKVDTGTPFGTPIRPIPNLAAMINLPPPIFGKPYSGPQTFVTNGPEFVFQPAWSVECNTSGDGRRLLLIGRATRSQGTSRNPLAIDLNSWEVSVDSWPLAGDGVHRNGCVALGDKLLASWGNSSWLHEPGKAPLRAGGSGAMYEPLVAIEQGNEIYLAGRSWCRVPRADGRRGISIPVYNSLNHWSRSAHYGIVGWTPPVKFCQVAIQDPDPPSAPDSSPPRQSPVPQRFELAEQDRTQIVHQIEELLQREFPPPKQELLAYHTGVAHHDGWLPVFGRLNQDPPQKREGFRLRFHEGRLTFVDDLRTGRLENSLHYDEEHRLRLIVNYGSNPLDPPSGCAWAEYNAQGQIARVIKLSSGFQFSGATVYRHAADRSSTTVAQYLFDGRLHTQSTRTPSGTTHSHFESVYPPRDFGDDLRRYGLESFYPLEVWHSPRG